MQVGDKMQVLYDGTLPAGNILVSAEAADKTIPKTPSYILTGYRWIQWGDNDLLPTEMRQKIEQVPIAGATLDKKNRMTCGNGLMYYKNADLAKAKGGVVDRHYDQRIEDFIEENRLQTEWFPAQVADYNLPYNSFSEIILSRDKRTATGLYHIPAEHARLAKPNTRNRVEYLAYSQHFPFRTAQQDENRVAIPLYRWYEKQAFLDSLLNPKMAWHTRFPTPGLLYYARAWWMGLFRENGWLDVSAQVPNIVSAMQKNQIALKYIIAIPESYFMLRHPNFNILPDEERRKIIDDKVGELNASLSGTSNVFKSIAYTFRENEITGAAMGKIEITPVDDKTKEGTWVPDSYAADAQIVQGFGMDPSQIGLASGKNNMGAGSGSDKRESYNLIITLNTPEQRIIMEPLNWIGRHNNWGVTFMVDHTMHTTTNDKEDGLKPSPNTINPKPSGNDRKPN